MLIGAMGRKQLAGTQLVLFTLLMFFYLCAIMHFKPFVKTSSYQFSAATCLCQFMISFAGIIFHYSAGTSDFASSFLSGLAWAVFGASLAGLVLFVCKHHYYRAQINKPSSSANQVEMAVAMMKRKSGKRNEWKPRIESAETEVVAMYPNPIWKHAPDNTREAAKVAHDQNSDAAV